MDLETRAIVSMVWLLTVGVIAVGSAVVARRCFAAFRIWGRGQTGRGLTAANGLEMLAWFATLVGWLELLNFGEPARGSIAMFTGLGFKLLALYFAYGGYDSLVRFELPAAKSGVPRRRRDDPKE